MVRIQIIRMPSQARMDAGGYYRGADGNEYLTRHRSITHNLCVEASNNPDPQSYHSHWCENIVKSRLSKNPDPCVQFESDDRQRENRKGPDDGEKLSASIFIPPGRRGQWIHHFS